MKFKLIRWRNDKKRVVMAQVGEMTFLTTYCSSLNVLFDVWTRIYLFMSIKCCQVVLFDLYF